MKWGKRDYSEENLYGIKPSIPLKKSDPNSTSSDLVVSSEQLLLGQ